MWNQMLADGTMWNQMLADGTTWNQMLAGRGFRRVLVETALKDRLRDTPYPVAALVGRTDS